MKRVLICIFCICFMHNLFGQVASYINPILQGSYPDPSICKVKDTFYLVNSTFEYFPGLPIHKSTDLVNWELIVGIAIQVWINLLMPMFLVQMSVCLVTRILKLTLLC